MKKANRRMALCGVFMMIALLNQPIHAQNLNNVKLFESYFFDTPITQVTYGEGGLRYGTYDSDRYYQGTATKIGVQGGYPVNEKIEVDADIDYLSFSPEQGDGQSGLSDLAVYGRYLLKADKTNSFSAGGMLALPIGSEDVGQGNFDFGVFGAMRHQLGNEVIITGSAAVIFDEYKMGNETERKTYLRLGGGAIYPMNPTTAIVFECVMQTQWDYSLASLGVAHQMGENTLRGAIGFGLDNGAPDFSIIAKYAITL